MYSFWELYSVSDLLKQVFSSTVKCVGKCDSEWFKTFFVIIGSF